MTISIAISESFGKFHMPKGFDSEAVGTQWRIDLTNYLTIMKWFNITGTFIRALF